MHKSFIISEEERKRILGFHKNVTKKQYLLLKEVMEPYEPSEEDRKDDAQNAFKTVPCVTKTKWLRGVDDANDVYYVSKADSPLRYYGEYLNTSQTMSPPTIYKQTGTTDNDLVYIRRWNCNQRPFSTPAQSGEELRAGKKFIYIGDSTPAMTQIKGFLKELGKLTEDADMSEKYDKVTYNAIREFQKEKGLKVDGIIGPKTYSALFSSQIVQMEPKQITDVLSTQIASEKEKQEKEQESKMTIKTNDSGSNVALGGGTMGQAIGNAVAQDLKNSSYNMEPW